MLYYNIDRLRPIDIAIAKALGYKIVKAKDTDNFIRYSDGVYHII